MLNSLELTGRTRSHVVQRDDLRAALHPEALQAFLDMRSDAARAGFDIVITSGFRDFAAQQRIWDLKFRGERVLLDRAGEPLDHALLSEEALVDAILCWSALPGASRHHWGSDVDVVDAAAMPDGYRVQLVRSEAAPGGIFHALHCWLDANMARCGFFRPYQSPKDGVSPEPWHLSFAAVSVPALAALTPELVSEAVLESDMHGKALVIQRLHELYHRYVANVDPPAPPGAV